MVFLRLFCLPCCAAFFLLWVVRLTIKNLTLQISNEDMHGVKVVVTEYSTLGLDPTGEVLSAVRKAPSPTPPFRMVTMVQLPCFDQEVSFLVHQPYICLTDTEVTQREAAREEEKVAGVVLDRKEKEEAAAEVGEAKVTVACLPVLYPQVRSL